MSQGLPKRWTSCEIGEVAKVVGGATPPSKDPTNFDGDGGVPWITPADLSAYRGMYIRRGARNLSGKGFATCSAAMLPAGTVLFSSRAPVGYVAIAANPVCTNQGFKSFVLPEGLDSRFVYYYLCHIRPIAEERATGTTFKELSGAAASRLPLKIAPTDEQKRIADKLDAVLARVDACRERLDRVPAILKRFRQAVLAAATSGELTEDWRIADGLETPWKPGMLGDVGAVTGGLTKNSKRASFPLRKRYLRVANVYAGRLQLADVAEIGLTESEYEKTRLRVGDLLIVEGNGSVDQIGRAAMWNGELEQCTHQNHLIRWRSNGTLKPAFALIWLLSPTGRMSLATRAASSAGLYTLSISKVSVVPIMIPPLSEQAEIVRRVESLFAYADRLEARYAAARAQVERLTPALLAKAFRGELVPQDPNDEPASVLLERIRAARAAAPAKPRRRSTALSDRQVEKAEFVPPSRASLASVAKLEPGNDEGNADDARVDPHLSGAS